MTALAFDLIFNAGEYVDIRDDFPEIRPRYTEHMFCKKFLAKVVLRAIFDLCMYKDGNPHFESAYEWVSGESYSVYKFSDLLDLVGWDGLMLQFQEMADEENIPRERVRKIKGVLYNLEDHGSSRESD